MKLLELIELLKNEYSLGNKWPDPNRKITLQEVAKLMITEEEALNKL